MRYRVTVRGDGVELRGYVDGEAWGVENTDLNFADLMKPFGIVVASEAADDYDPFTHSADPSLQSILGMMQDNSIIDLPSLIMHMANIHYMQAQVIQGERARADAAETELRDRELHHFEVEEENARLKAEQKEGAKDGSA